MPVLRSFSRQGQLAFALSLISVILSGCYTLREESVHSSLSSRCFYLNEVLEFSATELQQETQLRPKCGAYSKEEYLNILVTLLREETNEDELEKEEHVFKTIGLIPNDYAYSSCIYEAFFQEAAAFYSPSRKEIVLPKWSEPSLTTLLHESVHYLQDNLLDLSKNTHLKGLFSDAALSVGSVLEGDAEYQTERLIPKAEEIIPLKTLVRVEPLQIPRPECQLPAKLQRLFQFQYESGYMFWNKITQLKKAPARLEILRSPPLQTRFILHPEHWLSNRHLSEEAETKSCSTKNGLYSKSLGAISIYSILQRPGENEELREVLKHLTTDCLSDDGTSINWSLTWETEEAAKQFLALLSKTEERELPTPFWEQGSRHKNRTTFRQISLR